MADKHTHGDQVYSIHGEAGRYIARVTNGHLVEPVYEDDDNEGPAYADPVTWREVFLKPPRQRLEAEIAQLEKQRAEAAAALATVRADRAVFDKEERERLARLKQDRQLTRIDEWLGGKITHFVVWERYSDRIKVKAFDEVMKSERGSYEVPLLVLYGSLERDHEIHRTKIEWCRMSDGNALRVIPCNSEDAARLLAREVMQHAVQTWRARAKQYASTWYQDSTPKHLAEDMAALGMEPPADVIEARDRLAKLNADAALIKAREELAKAQLALKQAECAMPSTAGVA